MMSQFILDLFFVLIFVMFLTMLFKIKEKTFADNKDSYRYTVSGILILLTASLIRLANHQNMFDSVPILSEDVYRNLAEAITIIAGVALMIAGVSIWLPGRKKIVKDDSANHSKISALRNIEKAIHATDNIELLFENVAQEICRTFGFISSAIFRYSSRKNLMLCSNIYNFSLDSIQMLNGYRLSVSAGSDCHAKIAADLSSDYYMKLESGSNRFGSIHFWLEKNAKLTNEDIGSIKDIANIFSKRLDALVNINKLKFYEDNARYLARIKEIGFEKISIDKSFANLHGLFKSVTGAEYISLAIMDKNQNNFKRFTSGIDKKMLLEDGTRLPIKGTQIETVLNSQKAVFIDDVTPLANPHVEALFLNCNQRSLMAIPIVNSGRVIGVMTLGHSQVGHFKRLDLKRCQLMAAAMAPMLEIEITRQLLAERDRYLSAIVSFDGIVEKCSTINEILKYGSQTILDNIRTSMVRISLLNKERTELQTHALQTIRPLGNIHSEAVAISKELTPWHNMAIKEHRLMLINRMNNKTAIEKMEAESLLFENVQSALILPILSNGIVVGIITMGEMREWNRFSFEAPAIMFCREIASKIGNAIKNYQLSQNLININTETKTVLASQSDRMSIVNDLKSPVTSLRGSLDLLKMKEFGGSKISRRVLESLEESTEKIISLISE
ncbi:MAG: GAF domain-containing protein [Candidatus Zixiibacteriota bacterium]